MTDRTPLNPNFTAGPTGLDPYRPLRHVVVDGELFVTNGWDAPRRWLRGSSTWAYMGSAAPADFGALSLTGSPGTAIPTGQTARYYLVGYDPVLDKETAPQGGGDVTIANSSGSTKDVVIPWTPGSLPAEFTKRRIYRPLYQTGDYHLVAQVSDGDGTYTDTTPDATLRTNGSATWDGTIRTTLPPLFTGFHLAKGIVFAWTKNTNFVYYSRGIRPSGTYVADDFPDANLVAVGADDGTGGPRAMRSFQGTKILWKRSSMYEFTGESGADFEFNEIPGSRGTFNTDTVVKVGQFLVCLDEKGAYRVSPGLTASGAAVDDGPRAPEQPILDRLNLGVSDLFTGVYLPTSGSVVFWVALDFDPTPDYGLVYDSQSLQFQGIITRRNVCAYGWLKDGQGTPHPVFGDDVGMLAEDLQGQTEGVTAGATSATATGLSGLVLSFGVSTFSTTINGPTCSPLDRTTPAGVVMDENRVYTNTTSTLTLLLYPSDNASVVGDTASVGVIPAYWESGGFNFDTHELKDVRMIFIEYESTASATLRVETAINDDIFVWKLTEDTSTGVWGYVPTVSKNNANHDQCRMWRVRISQRAAGGGFSIRGVHVQFNVIHGVLKK